MNLKRERDASVIHTFMAICSIPELSFHLLCTHKMLMILCNHVWMSSRVVLYIFIQNWRVISERASKHEWDYIAGVWEGYFDTELRLFCFTYCVLRCPFLKHSLLFMYNERSGENQLYMPFSSYKKGKTSLWSMTVNFPERFYWKYICVLAAYWGGISCHRWERFWDVFSALKYSSL